MGSLRTSTSVRHGMEGDQALPDGRGTVRSSNGVRLAITLELYDVVSSTLPSHIRGSCSAPLALLPQSDEWGVPVVAEVGCRWVGATMGGVSPVYSSS